MEITPNSTHSTTSATPAALSNVQRPGQYLRQTRDAQKIELSHVARALNISIKTLSALEADDYRALPEVAFIKGYYRSYAKFLNVDASAIIQRFDEIYTNDTGVLPNYALNNSPIKMMGKLASSKNANKRKWLKRSVMIIALLLVVVVAVLFANDWLATNKSDKSEPIQSTATAPNNVEVLPLGGVNSISGDALSLSFARPTTVRVVDATGKILINGRQENPITVYGETPFQIRLVDPAAVSMSLNQEPISLSPYMGKSVAEFRLSR